jgi:hypothetical protein
MTPVNVGLLGGATKAATAARVITIKARATKV